MTVPVSLFALATRKLRAIFYVHYSDIITREVTSDFLIQSDLISALFFPLSSTDFSSSTCFSIF